MNDPHTDGRRDPVDLLAKCGFRQDGQDSAGAANVGWGGHWPTVPGRHAAPPAANADLWTKPDLWTARSLHPAKPGGGGEELTRQKGRPPPGGEEARVVVNQPRGVGLIHPRLGRVILTIHTRVSRSARVVFRKRHAISK